MELAKVEMSNRVYDSPGVVTYNLIQNGLIGMFCLLGLATLVHVVCCRQLGQCRNRLLIVMIVSAGFVHHIGGIYALCYQEAIRVGNQDCVDISFLVALTNAVICLAIGLSIIQVNTDTTMDRCSGLVAYSVSILAGLVLIRRANITYPSLAESGDLWNVDILQADIKWAICTSEIISEKYKLISEYCFINLPLLVVVILAWRKSRKNGPCKRSLQILRTDCQAVPDKHGGTTTCQCSKINVVFVAMVTFWIVMMFLARPALLLYAYETSGYFRDSVPSVVLYVCYSFICVHYLTALHETNTGHNVKQRKSCVMHV